MKIGTNNRKQTIMAAVLGVLALGAFTYIYEEVFAGSSPAPATAAPTLPATSSSKPSADIPVATSSNKPATGTAAKSVGTTSAALDSTLHMEAMLVTESVVYSGSGRNIFSANSAPPVVIQKPIATARVVAPPPPVPCPPNCPPPPPPPPPPPIDLKLFGVETSANGTRQAFLLHGDNVFLASAGDIVMRSYRVVSIEPKSVRIEDMQNKNTQTLPLLTN